MRRFNVLVYKMLILGSVVGIDGGCDVRARATANQGAHPLIAGEKLSAWDSRRDFCVRRTCAEAQASQVAEVPLGFRGRRLLRRRSWYQNVSV